MKKHTNTFTATSDDGKIYTINEYTDYHNAGSFENPDQNVEGFKELRTSDGNTVNRINNLFILSPSIVNTYRIIAIFLTLR